MFDILIKRLKLSIATVCNLRCRYCFIRERNSVMSYSTARSSIDLLISGSHKNKRSLCLYGGEPFLQPLLLQKVVNHARSRSKSFAVPLTIACCTNATLLNKDILGFFAKQGVYLSVSLFAKPSVHDRMRPLVNGKGTYDSVIKSVYLARKIIPQELLSLSLCVSSVTARDLVEDFLFATQTLGIRYINLELIKRAQLWSDASVAHFCRGFKSVLERLIRGIENGNCFYLDVLSRELATGHAALLSKMSQVASFCPKESCLEVYPDGSMGFSVFLLNRPDRDKYVLGNVNEFKKSKIADCHFSADSACCRQCIKSYFVSAGSRLREIMLDKYHNDLLIKASVLIKHRALTDARYRKYIQNACKRVY